jgi:hypothetical protein
MQSFLMNAPWSLGGGGENGGRRVAGSQQLCKCLSSLSMKFKKGMVGWQAGMAQMTSANFRELWNFGEGRKEMAPFFFGLEMCGEKKWLSAAEQEIE